MIYLTKGQPLFDNPSMVVCDQTGYYEDGSPVICAAAYDPENPACRYEAKFIAYGNAVYNITDPDLLMKQVLEIDPKSLFGKNNQDVATDKVVENIQMVDTTETPVPPPIQSSPESVFTNPAQVETALSTSTPSVITPVDVPPVDNPPIEIIPIDTSTTTPLTNIVENTSTTTPLTDITF